MEQEQINYLNPDISYGFLLNVKLFLICFHWIWFQNWSFSIINIIHLKLVFLLIVQSRYFKVNLITYKSITLTTSLFREIFSNRDVSHNLSSKLAISLFRPYTKGFDSHAYVDYAPKLWNALPKLCRVGPCLSQRP